jgi:hypothetical protein
MNEWLADWLVDWKFQWIPEWKLTIKFFQCWALLCSWTHHPPHGTHLHSLPSVSSVLCCVAESTILHTVLTSTDCSVFSLVLCYVAERTILHIVLTSTDCPVFSLVLCYVAERTILHTVLTSTVCPMFCSVLRCVAVDTGLPVSVSLPGPTPWRRSLVVSRASCVCQMKLWN